VYIKDAAGTTHETQEEIMRTLASSISGDYQDILVDRGSVDAICSKIQCKLTIQQQAQLSSAGDSARSRKEVAGSGRCFCGFLPVKIDSHQDGDASSV
jgi:hypothetical protein